MASFVPVPHAFTWSRRVRKDEHTIDWDDGTRWEEVKPDGADWKAYTGAAIGGAAAGGATGYLLDKKFFNKASNGVESDYVILLDVSAPPSLAAAATIVPPHVSLSDSVARYSART